MANFKKTWLSRMLIGAMAGVPACLFHVLEILARAPRRRTP